MFWFLRVCINYMYTFYYKFSQFLNVVIISSSLEKRIHSKVFCRIGFFHKLDSKCTCASSKVYGDPPVQMNIIINTAYSSQHAFSEVEFINFGHEPSDLFSSSAMLLWSALYKQLPVVREMIPNIMNQNNLLL